MKLISEMAMLTALCVGLGGCVYSQPHLAPHLGSAVRLDAMAQIADPDVRYNRPPPPTDGPRMWVAQQRYQTDTEVPANAHSSTIGDIQAVAPQLPPASPTGSASAPLPAPAPSGP